MNERHAMGDPLELASAYLAGAMTAEQFEAFESHLAEGCPQCSSEVARLQPALETLMDAIEPAAVDDALRERVLGAINKSDSGHQVWKQWTSSDPSGVSINRSAGAEWEDIGIDGIRVRRLFVDRARNQMTAMVRMAPGTSYPGHLHDGPEECLVLEGDLKTGDHVLRSGDYQRMARGTHHGVQSTEDGCLLLIVSSLTDEAN